MSFNHMYGTNKPSYEMGSFNPMFSSTYQPSQSTSIALFHIPADSTNSLYVDGVPSDATEREVSHIFRPFPGFKCLRLIRKTTVTGREFLLCFVDFQNVLQSTIAMNTLQDYRFDRHDKTGLKISYGKDAKQMKEKSKRYK